MAAPSFTARPASAQPGQRDLDRNHSANRPDTAGRPDREEIGPKKEEPIMRLQSACYLVGAALCLTAPAWAQSTAITPTSTHTGTQVTSTGTGTGTQTTSTSTGTQSSTSTGAFQNLSPGGQKIAQSLFDAQHPPSGTNALTLD